MKLVEALDTNKVALATAFSAAAGVVPPATTATAATEIPSSRLPDAMASLWRRTAHAMDQDNDDHSSSSSSSSSKKGKAKKGKKRSSSDEGSRLGSIGRRIVG